MSSIIKSYRVVESLDHKEVEKKTNEVEMKLNEDLLEEGRKKYEELIEKAKKESLDIIESAEIQKESIINDAYNRAKDILEDSKIKGYNEGYERGKEEGYDIGYAEGKSISDDLVKESLKLKQKYIEMKSNLLKELESDVIDLVISIYEKIINEKNESDTDLIISLVLNGINNLDLTDKLTIITSKEDYNILEMKRDEILAKASMITELEIKYDMDFQKGECVLETSKGNIDVSLNNQLDEVRELLTTILNNE